MDNRSGLPVLICPSQCTFLQSSQFWAANHDTPNPPGSHREFLQISFWDISSARCGPHGALFCASDLPCRAHRGCSFLDYVALEWESIQSPLVQMLAGFAFNQEMSTSATDHSMIPIEKTLRTLHFRHCFAEVEQLYIAHFTNHHFRFVTEWFVDVICCKSAWRARRWGWPSIFFTSSRTRKLSASQLHVAIQTLWSQCLFPRAEWTNRLVVYWQVSPF